MNRTPATLSDLRPNAQIVCFRCNLAKPQVGAVKFRAHLVCADCAKRLQALDKAK